MNQHAFSWKKRGHSIGFAWQGIMSFFRTEHNARIHAAFTLIVLLLGLLFHIAAWEWCMLVIIMSMVWMAEIFNTAIEKAMDHVSMEVHPRIKLVKDLSAAAVLLTAIAAVIIGLFVFIPKISLLW
jgi:diacylglycerol kinase